MHRCSLGQGWHDMDIQNKENILDKLDWILASERSARILFDVIVEGYGIRDMLDCMYYNLNETDQKKFLDIAFIRAIARE